MDSSGQLVVSRVDYANSTVYVCVGVDAAGNCARARIRVVTVDPGEGEGRESERETSLRETCFPL